MGWHYAMCKKYTVHKGKKYPFWCVVEYFPDVDGRDCWSNDPESPNAESKKELIEMLKMMLEDIQHYPAIIEKEVHIPDRKY